jgi:hypothetical protein
MLSHRKMTDSNLKCFASLTQKSTRDGKSYILDWLAFAERTLLETWCRRTWTVEPEPRLPTGIQLRFAVTEAEADYQQSNAVATM